MASWLDQSLLLSLAVCLLMTCSCNALHSCCWELERMLFQLCHSLLPVYASALLSADKYMVSAAVSGHGWTQYLPVCPGCHDPLVWMVWVQPWKPAGYHQPCFQQLLLCVSSCQRRCYNFTVSCCCGSHRPPLDCLLAQAEDWQAPLGYHGHG